jgi:hypothetical protein
MDGGTTVIIDPAGSGLIMRIVAPCCFTSHQLDMGTANIYDELNRWNRAIMPRNST